MKGHAKKLGAEGEAAAVALLREKGYEIIAQNLFLHHDEVDILAKDGKTLVFVEVKTRVTNSFGVPEDFVTSAKERHMIRAAENYIFENDWQGETRFDIVAVHYEGKTLKTRHIEDAFYPGI